VFFVIVIVNENFTCSRTKPTSKLTMLSVSRH